VIGVLAFNSRDVREPEDRLMQAISVIGSQIGQFLQRKRREEELRRFRTAMDVSEDMIWLLDPVNMKVIDINDTACRKLGYSREELLSKAPQDIISMSREELLAIYSRLIEGGEGDHRRGRLVPAQGRLPVFRSRPSVAPSSPRGATSSSPWCATSPNAAPRRKSCGAFRLAMDNSADMIVLSTARRCASWTPTRPRADCSATPGKNCSGWAAGRASRRPGGARAILR